MASGNCNPIVQANVAVTGSMDIDSQSDTFSITLSPKTYDYKSTRNPLTGSYHFPPRRFNLAPNYLLESLSKATYPWKYEVNSEYPGESVYASFQRLSRSEKYSRGGYKDEVTGKIFKERFWLKMGSVEVPVNVATYPYRNGSKIVVYAELTPVVIGRSLDYAQTAKLFESRIKEIVDS